MSEAAKTCSKYSAISLEVPFPKRKDATVCSPCINAGNRKRYADDPSYRESRKERARQFHEKHPDKQRNSALRRSYGITLKEYDAMLAQQGGTCAICFGPPNLKGRFFVDHDHETNKVRSLLCGTCNAGLGQFRESPEILNSAIAYLKKYGK